MKRKRKHITTSRAERAARISANFAFYDEIKKALDEHDKLNADFENAILNDKLLKDI